MWYNHFNGATLTAAIIMLSGETMGIDSQLKCCFISGTRNAMLNTEARTIEADVLSRRCVLMRLAEFSFDKFQEAIRQSAGAVVIILPQNMSMMPQDVIQVKQLSCILPTHTKTGKKAAVQKGWGIPSSDWKSGKFCQWVWFALCESMGVNNECLLQLVTVKWSVQIPAWVLMLRRAGRWGSGVWTDFALP